MNQKIFFAIILTMVSQTVLASSFERNVFDIQVLSDRVRIKIGTTYGTCGSYEGWWGWATSNPRHKDWLSIVLSAQAQNRKIVVLDEQNSCAGPGGDTIGLEGLSIK